MPDPAYDYWEAWRSRTSSTGIAMMPLSGPPPMPSVPVVLDGGSEYDLVTFAAARWQLPPIIPAPVLLQSNSNRVLLGGGQSALFPIPFFGDTKLFQITGWYLFGIINPEGLISDMPLGTPPMGPGDGPLTFEEYLRMAGIQNLQLITQTPPGALPTGDGSQPEQLPPLEYGINTRW